MEVLVRNRTIRPSENNTDYRYSIDVSDAEINDLIIIFIDHESEDYRTIYWTSGDHTTSIDHIHFKITKFNNEITVIWENETIMTQML